MEPTWYHAVSISTCPRGATTCSRWPRRDRHLRGSTCIRNSDEHVRGPGPSPGRVSRSSGERRRPRWLRELRGGDARPRPARLHGGGGEFLEAADAPQYRQAAICRHADVRGCRADRRRLPAADRPDGRRNRLPERCGRQLLQLSRRRDVHRPAHHHLCAADRVALHPDPDDAHTADLADEATRVRLPRGPLVSRRCAERERAVERQGWGARETPGPRVRAHSQGALANPGVRRRGVSCRGRSRD